LTRITLQRKKKGLRNLESSCTSNFNTHFMENTHLNRIIIDSNKRAVLPWKAYQQRQVTAAELEQQRRHPNAHGEAIICGAVSGNLEVIDCDLKYDHEGKVRAGLMDAIPEAIRERLQVVETRSGGWHLYYRCATIAGNMKLAQRPTTEAEANGNPSDKVRVLIETRGRVAMWLPLLRRGIGCFRGDWRIDRSGAGGVAGSVSVVQ
jgi:hypothetical protein